jgi:hypothetical protein
MYKKLLYVLLVISFKISALPVEIFDPASGRNRTMYAIYNGVLPDSISEAWLMSLKESDFTDKPNNGIPLHMKPHQKKLIYSIIVFPEFTGTLALQEGVETQSILFAGKKKNDLKQQKIYAPNSYFKLSQFYSFPISKGDTLYIYSVQTSNVPVPNGYTLLDFKTFSNLLFYRTAVAYSTVAFLGISLILSLLFAFKNREKIYLFYSSYLAFTLLFYLYFWYMIPQPGLLEQPGYYHVTLPYICMTISVFLYGREYLRTFGILVMSGKWVLAFIALRFIIFLVGFFSGNLLWNNPVIDFIFIFPVLYKVPFLLQTKKPYAKSFAFSFILISIFLLIHSLEFRFWNFLGIGSNFFFAQRVFVELPVILLEIILFNFSLYQRFHFMQGEVGTLKDNLISELTEKERYKQELNENLEKLVHERTKELKHANKLISNQAEELISLNEMLKKENTELASEIEIVKRSNVLKESITYAEFKEVFPDDETCQELLAGLKWQTGYLCLKCGYKKYYAGKTPYSRKCKLCKTDESATSHTAIEGIKIPLSQAFYVAFCVIKKKDWQVSQIYEETGLRKGTAIKYYQYFSERAKLIQPVKWLDLVR